MKTQSRLVRAGIAGLLLALASVGSSWAQPADQTYGIKGGISWANLFHADAADAAISSAFPAGSESDYLTWWTAGLYCSHDIIKDMIALQMEMSYLQGGKSWKIQTAAGTDHIQLATDYLHLPVLVKFWLPVSSAFKTNVYIGPHVLVAFRTKSKNLDDLDSADRAAHPSFLNGFNAGASNQDNKHNVFDAGFSTGLQVSVPAGPGSFDFDFRYVYGGLNAYNFPAADRVDNYIFLLTLGYSL